MSLFGFADISFEKGATIRGPLQNLVISPYPNTTYKYPSDIGQYDKGHYMIFYIRKQSKTKYATQDGSEGAINSSPGGFPTTGGVAVPAAGGFGGSLLNSLASSISSALPSGVSSLISRMTKLPSAGQQSTQTEISNSIKSLTGGSVQAIKVTKLSQDAIALYMPDTLMYSYDQSYDNANVGSELGGKIAGAGISAMEGYQKNGGAGIFDSVVKTAVLEAGRAASNGTASNIAGSNSAKLGFQKLTGQVQNPMLEMIYSSPQFRKFTFEFKFYPRDSKEALQVQNIIGRFRFHQAPEFAQGSSKAFLVPPSEFEIRMYYGGQINPNLPSFATCILTSINVDYAPDGFSAYESPNEDRPSLGKTGMPVCIVMTLNFQETTYLTKEDFLGSNI
jgi:hypothetical protein